MTILPAVGIEKDLVGSSSLMATEGIDDPTSAMSKRTKDGQKQAGDGILREGRDED